jgi:ketosteroid isomerase-like protein
LEVVRRGFEHFRASGQPDVGLITPDFVWDMTNFLGWPDQQVYRGVDGMLDFLAEWISAWDDWELEMDVLHDAGEKVVAVMRQRGRSKVTGMLVEMSFAQVFTSAMKSRRGWTCIPTWVRPSKPWGSRSSDVSEPRPRALHLRGVGAGRLQLRRPGAP